MDFHVQFYETVTGGSPVREFLDALEEFLRTASELAPRNAPRARELKAAVREFQKVVENLIEGDIATARRLSAVVDVHTLKRLDERTKAMRATQMTRHMTTAIRRASR